MAYVWFNKVYWPGWSFERITWKASDGLLLIENQLVGMLFIAIMPVWVGLILYILV